MNTPRTFTAPRAGRTGGTELTTREFATRELATRLAAATAPSSAVLKSSALKPGKARQASLCQVLEQIPNIGPSLAEDLRQIGILHPDDLVTKDAFVLYQQLCVATGQRQDPCVLDTFMAATDFMRGAAAAPWWHYTPHRKALYGQLEGDATDAPHAQAVLP